MITTLLIIIAVAEVARLVLTHIPVTQKSYFKQRLAGTQRLIWDLEFKAHKTREIREDVRKEYSNMMSRIDSLKTQVANWPADKDEGDKKRLEDQIVLCQRDADRFVAQMRQLDTEVEGAPKTNENPDGVDGIVQQIGQLKEVQIMLKDWIKKV